KIKINRGLPSVGKYISNGYYKCISEVPKWPDPDPSLMESVFLGVDEGFGLMSCAG
ncbi:unnamed protein product, partial [Prunus brigantina]